MIFYCNHKKVKISFKLEYCIMEKNDTSSVKQIDGAKKKMHMIPAP
jgi:hypothetical protein